MNCYGLSETTSGITL